MGMKVSAGIVFLVLAQGLAGCGGSELPTQPPPPSPPPRPIQLVVFTDPLTGLQTSDVRDVHGQIVRFNSAGELVWTADSTRFSGYRVNGDDIRGPGPDDWFQVRFGTKNGERRAYLGWDDDFCHCPGSSATIVSIEVVSGRLVITATDVPVPGSYPA